MKIFNFILSLFTTPTSQIFDRPAEPSSHRPPARKRPARIPQKVATSDDAPSRATTTDTLKGRCYVIDGDTIIISKVKIRIAGIDAPELEHPWGKKSKFAVVNMCKGKIVTAKIMEDVSYDRIVAKCYLPDGTDIAAELVKQGLALDWPKFSGGEYRSLEPADARKKLWRAAARQQGRMKAFNSPTRPPSSP